MYLFCCRQWAPNRGLELIKMGYTMNHMVKHLLPQDYTLIFKVNQSENNKIKGDVALTNDSR